MKAAPRATPIDSRMDTRMDTRMDARKPNWTARLRRMLAGLRPSAARDRYDEILSHSGRTLSLDELLVLFPERVCAALNLASFDIFLRQGNQFLLERPAGRDTTAIAFPASGSTVSRMKRDRKPAAFNADPPEPWQLLATAQEIAALEQLNARTLVPLEGRTGLMGFATLAPQPGKNLSRQDLAFLRELGPQMGRGLETAQFIRTASEAAIQRAHAQRELELAREVQERLLPVRIPETQGLEAAAFYRSAEEIGGDYYDLFHTDAGALCCAVGDVSGKGISSALLMATLRASLRTLMLHPGLRPVEIVARLNSELYQASSMARYATFFFALYDPQGQTLTYVNAGHNPPLLLHASGVITRLTCGGSVLGLLPGLTFDQETLPFVPGDQLIAYTDGINESINPQGVEWEEAGLLAALSTQADQTAATTITNIRKALELFTAGTPQPDDMTLVVLRRVQAIKAEP